MVGFRCDKVMHSLAPTGLMLYECLGNLTSWTGFYQSSREKATGNSYFLMFMGSTLFDICVLPNLLQLQKIYF